MDPSFLVVSLYTEDRRGGTQNKGYHPLYSVLFLQSTENGPTGGTRDSSTMESPTVHGDSVYSVGSPQFSPGLEPRSRPELGVIGRTTQPSLTRTTPGMIPVRSTRTFPSPMTPVSHFEVSIPRTTLRFRCSSTTSEALCKFRFSSPVYEETTSYTSVTPVLVGPQFRVTDPLDDDDGQ